jgi:glycosyltransferase involved in cell wall biosynthesis
MTNAPTRILLWSVKGSSEQYHGPGSFAYRLYSLADPRDVQVTLVHSSSDQPRLDLFHDQHYIPGGRGVLGTLAFLRRAVKWVRANARNYDVFHGLVAYHTTIQPAYEAHQLGLPAVVFIATHQHELADKPGLRSLLGWPRKRRQMIRELDGIIAMSRAIYEDLIEVGVAPRRIARIPMGVNTDRFRPLDDERQKSEIRRELGLAERPTLVFVGAIIRRKQPHLLVEAVGKLVHQKREIQLVIVGPWHEPDYQREILDLVRRDNLSEYVKFPGFTPQIERYHQASDMFALPALNEGMPAALVEAMSSGLACLGTPISGISDLIQDGVTGLIVQPTVDSVTQALTHYLDHPDQIREHGQRCRAQVLERYGANSVLNAYLELFRCVMAGRDACEASTLPEFH